MGRPPDLERVYTQHAQALYGFVLDLTRDEADTRDILQELFVRLARNPSLLAEVRDERNFLLRMVHNLSIDLIRRNIARQKRHEQSQDSAVEVFARADDPDTNGFRKALTEALGELPADQRAVVHLKLWEGETFDSIAEMLGISPNTAASRYRYGIDKLRQRLRPLYEETK